MPNLLQLGRRLARLERQACAIAGTPETKQAPDLSKLDVYGWLAFYETLGRAGEFGGEPDFAAALLEFREAVKTAEADPTRKGKIDFRDHNRFPRVAAAETHLFTMLDRVAHAQPTVSVHEFEELAQWFALHESQLMDWDNGCAWIHCGNDMRTTVGVVRIGLAKGAKDFDAGEIAETLRRARAHFNLRKACL